MWLVEYTRVVRWIARGKGRQPRGCMALMIWLSANQVDRKQDNQASISLSSVFLSKVQQSTEETRWQKMSARHGISRRMVVTRNSELNKSLELDSTSGSCELPRVDGNDRLIGQPRVRLDMTSLLPYLRTAHLMAELDKLIRYIRMVSDNERAQMRYSQKSNQEVLP